MNADDETAITEIELLPDGRICVFGMSKQVLELLSALQPDPASNVSQRLEQVSHVERPKRERPKA